MMRIYLQIREDNVCSQLIDAWVAYRQSKNTNYGQDLVLVSDPQHADVRVLFDNFLANTSNVELDCWDLVLAANNGEPVAVGTPHLRELIEHPRVRLITNSFVTPAHVLADKIFCLPHCIMQARTVWTSRFYPQFYENHDMAALVRDQTAVAITGSNYAWRQHFFKILQQQIPDFIVTANITGPVLKIQDSQWESLEDQEFRIKINQQVPQAIDPDPENYWQNKISVGLDAKFGAWHLGYFLMPLYYRSRMVIFAESAWQNNELSITEKSLKCFFAGSLPFPVGGASTNHLYNQLGFGTAWNLLPGHLARFDSMLDHSQRYQQQTQAIRWLIDNRTVFDSDHARELVALNRDRFLDGHAEVLAVRKFSAFMEDWIAHERA